MKISTAIILIRLFLILIFDGINSTPLPPLWVIMMKLGRYKQNEQCMSKQRIELDAHGSQPLKAVNVLQNATLWLECFPCLHPDDAEELEDVWKPSPSIIGRKIHKFLKALKEKIARSHKGKKARTRKDEFRNYRWERLNDKKKWVFATHGFDGDDDRQKKQSEIMDFIDEVMSKGKSNAKYKNTYIGDHMELEIRQVDGDRHRGWYRCVNRTNAKKPLPRMGISQIYFVDIITDKGMDIVMRSVNENEMNWSKAERTFANMSLPSEYSGKLHAFGYATRWSPCNRCGNRVGETRRTVMCYVKRNPSLPLDHFNAPLDVFLWFAELPCFSPLIPEKLRNSLEKSRSIYEEFTKCTDECFPPNYRPQLAQPNETQGPGVADYLPPGEFTMNERLPPLPPPIIRKTYFATEGNTLILDCSNQDQLALIWRKDFEELNGTRIIAEDGVRKPQRRLITASGQLIIRHIHLSDKGLFSCVTFPGGHILRTFRIYVATGDQTAHLVDLASFIFKLLLFIYMMVLLIDTLNVSFPVA